MHQHVCNIKLLQLICIILENVKCLKEVKENLIVLKSKVKVANKFLIKSKFLKIRVLHMGGIHRLYE
jgi:hypothetical protein